MNVDKVGHHFAPVDWDSAEEFVGATAFGVDIVAVDFKADEVDTAILIFADSKAVVFGDLKVEDSHLFRSKKERHRSRDWTGDCGIVVIRWRSQRYGCWRRIPRSPWRPSP